MDIEYGETWKKWFLCCVLVTLGTSASVVKADSGFGAIRNLDHTVILCEDIEAMRSFYTKVLQFEVHHEIQGQWIELKVGSSLLTLRPRNRPYDGPPIASRSASLQLAFRVPPMDVDHSFTTLKKLRVKVLDPPKDQSWGHRTLFFADPENNVIEIYAEI